MVAKCSCHTCQMGTLSSPQTASIPHGNFVQNPRTWWMQTALWMRAGPHLTRGLADSVRQWRWWDKVSYHSKPGDSSRTGSLGAGEKAYDFPLETYKEIGLQMTKKKKKSSQLAEPITLTWPTWWGVRTCPGTGPFWCSAFSGLKPAKHRVFKVVAL